MKNKCKMCLAACECFSRLVWVLIFSQQLTTQRNGKEGAKLTGNALQRRLRAPNELCFVAAISRIANYKWHNVEAGIERESAAPICTSLLVSCVRKVSLINI